MVLLHEKNITIPPSQYAKASSFVIDRVEVPADLTSLRLTFSLPQDMVKLLLIYDSHYNLRAEINDIDYQADVRISTESKHTSLGAKSGPLPDGEWIIAFEIDHKQETEDTAPHCHFIVQGIK